MAKSKHFEVKCTPTEFSVTLSSTYKFRDDYHKAECSITKSIPVDGDVDVDAEIDATFEQIATLVDKQLADVAENYK